MAKKKTTKKAEKKDTVKRLYRNEKKAVLGGVCAGIGDYTNLDPVLIRVLWVVFTAITFFGAGVLAYIIALLIMPKK
jgi:phage shock protein C